MPSMADTASEKVSEKSEKFSASVGETQMFKGFWDTYIFAIAIKWAVFASFWHFGLARGFREYLIAFAIMSVGYCMLACCLAEMVSVIAFPGGYYGYARCTVHPFFGYLVGCSGVIETVFVTAATVLRIGEVFTIVLGLPKKLEPLWWVLIHGSAIIVHVQPQQFYWYLMMVVTACCVLVLLTFLLGSTAVADFNKYSNIPHTKVDIFQSDWLEILSLPAIFYYGCDLVVVVANQVPNSKTVIPRAMLLGYATMAIVAVAIIFGTVSQSPGLSGKLFTIVFPLAFGFQTLFHITLNQATAYIIAPLISSLMGYMFVSSRMISSFARSGLLPAVLKPKRTGTTIAASSLTSMLATSAVGLCLQSVAWYYDTGISFRSALHAAFFVYIGMFVCYVVFKLRYSHLVRNFKSPFGVPGAILGFTIFTFAITSLMLSAINNIASCIYATSMGIFIIYYFLHAEAQQSFSAQEQQDFFKVYLINLNTRRRSFRMRTKLSFWRNWTFLRPRKVQVAPLYCPEDVNDDPSDPRGGKVDDVASRSQTQQQSMLVVRDLAQTEDGLTQAL